MSYYSYFGAYAAPAGSHDFLADVGNVTNEFHGSSRSGAFQKACKILLDAVPGHDLLRFLSGESATQKISSPGGVMTFATIEPGAAKSYVDQLDDLAHYYSERPEELATLWSSQLGGYSTEAVASAVSEARVCLNPNRETDHGEEGDNPHFAIAMLTTLRATIMRVCSAGSTLVYYTWQGE